AEDDQRKQGPEGDEKEIQKPARAAWRDQTQKGEQADDAEYEETDEDPLRERHWRRLDVEVRVGSRGRSPVVFRGCRQSAIQNLNDAGRAGFNAHIVVTLAKPRCHEVADDAVGSDVGKNAFQAVSHFDAHAAFAECNQDQHPVVLFGLAQLPALENPNREILNAFGANAIDGKNRYLVAGRTLVRL